MQQDANVNNPTITAWVLLAIVVAALLYMTIGLIVEHYDKKKAAEEALDADIIDIEVTRHNDDIIFKTIQESYPHDAH